MLMMDHYDCNELLWLTVMIIMGWKGSHQARDDNDDREPWIDAGYGHLWYQWYPVFLRGERHKGWWIHLYPDGFDFLLQMIQWYVKRIENGWTWGHGESSCTRFLCRLTVPQAAAIIGWVPRKRALRIWNSPRTSRCTSCPTWQGGS